MCALFLWCYFFLFGFNHRGRWDQGELSLLNHSWKVADGSATQTPAPDYTYTHCSTWSHSLAVPVWFGSLLLQRIVPTAAMLVMQCCTMSVKTKYIKIPLLSKRSCLFTQVLSLWHLRFWSCISFQIAGVCIWQNFVTGFTFRCGKQLKPWVQMTLTGNKSPRVWKQASPCRIWKGPIRTSWRTSKTFKLS